MKNIARHLSSYVAPVLVMVFIPYWIISSDSQSFLQPVLNSSLPLIILGVLIGFIGLAGAVSMMRLFILIGKGSIMPWDPTRKLITQGLYGHVRNPMILSILITLAGEALVFASRGIAIFGLVFFAINTVYFVLSEEPGLVKHFGAEYIEYKKNVPRWIPRIKPWTPGL